MDAKYINKSYLGDSIKDYDNTVIEPIRNVVSNIYYNTAASFNNVNNTFNDVNTISNDRYKDLISVINMITPGGIGLDLQLNYINSTSPVDYKSAKNIIFNIGQVGNIWCVTADKAGTQYYDWNSQSNTLTFSSLTGLITANANMDNMFAWCDDANFIGDIIVPNNATTMSFAFVNCRKLTQNILIPNSVTNLNSTFRGCSNLNQNILIPNSITDLFSTFEECVNLNQNILIPNSITDLFSTFHGCSNLNQNILIPNSVTKMPYAFMYCKNLNQSILIPNSVTQMYEAFNGCSNLNQNDIYIYSQNVDTWFSAFNGVKYIGNIHIPTSVPKDTSNFMYNCLVNGDTGYTFAPENIINDLPVDIAQWPPV